MFPTYSTGTVSIGAAATVVVGAGSLWEATNAVPGDHLVCDGHEVTIMDVTDVTHLAINAWPFTAVPGGTAYKIIQDSPLRFVGGQVASDMQKLVQALNTDGFYWFVDSNETVPDPSLGDDGQYALQASSGKVWLKIAGVWTYQGIYKALTAKGAYAGGTTYNAGEWVTDAGSSYVFINGTPSAGHAPPNVTYWQLLASKGDPGGTGLTGAGYGGSSTTSLLIATGSKVFALVAGYAYQVGNYVRASSAANGANFMEGLVTAYSAGNITINVTKIGGSGTLADWNFATAGAPGTGDLLSTNNLSDVANAATSRINLGINQRAYLAGLTLSTAGSSATFSVAAGVCSEALASYDLMVLASAISKTTSAWAVGNGNGGLDTGAIANSTWYHEYLIKRPDTGVVDVCFSTSASAPTTGGNIPAAYTRYRRIGSMKTNGSGQWIAFTQIGDHFLWNLPIADVSALNTTTTPANAVLTVPTGVVVIADIQADWTNTAAGAIALIYCPTIGTQGAGTPNGNWTVSNPVASQYITNALQIETNTSAQIAHVSNLSINNSLYIITRGWFDRRGRDN